jgi:hypothetical protein
VPSLDLYRQPDPFRTPDRREFRDLIDVLEYAIMARGGFWEPLDVQPVGRARGAGCGTVRQRPPGTQTLNPRIKRGSGLLVIACLTPTVLIFSLSLHCHVCLGTAAFHWHAHGQLIIPTTHGGRPCRPHVGTGQRFDRWSTDR